MCPPAPVPAACKQNIKSLVPGNAAFFWEKFILAHSGLLSASPLLLHPTEPLGLAWGTAEIKGELPLWGSGTTDRYSQKATQVLHYLLEHFVKTKNSRDSGIGESLERNSKYGQCQNMYLRYLRFWAWNNIHSLELIKLLNYFLN